MVAAKLSSGSWISCLQQEVNLDSEGGGWEALKGQLVVVVLVGRVGRVPYVLGWALPASHGMSVGNSVTGVFGVKTKPPRRDENQC